MRTIRGRAELATRAQRWLNGQRADQHGGRRILADFQASLDQSQPVRDRTTLSAIVELCCAKVPHSSTMTPHNLPLALRLFNDSIGLRPPPAAGAAVSQTTASRAGPPAEPSTRWKRSPAWRHVEEMKGFWAREHVPPSQITLLQERERTLLAAAVEAHPLAPEQRLAIRQMNRVDNELRPSSLLSVFPSCEREGCPRRARFGDAVEGRVRRCEEHQEPADKRCDISGHSMRLLAHRLRAATPPDLASSARACAYAFEHQSWDPALFKRGFLLYFAKCRDTKQLPPEALLLMRWLIPLARYEAGPPGDADASGGGPTHAQDGARALAPSVAKPKQNDKEGPRVIESLTCLLQACAAVGALDAALHVVAVARAHDVQPQEVLFRRLAWVAARCGNVYAAVTAAYYTREFGVDQRRDAALTTTIIHACAQRKQTRTARELYEKAVSHGLKPDVQVLAALVDVHAKAGDARGAVHFFEQALLLPDESERGHGVALASALAAFERSPDVDVAFQLFHRHAHLHSHLKGTSAFTSLVKGAASVGAPHLAEEALEAATRCGDEPDGTMLYFVLLAHAKSANPHSAFDAYERHYARRRPSPSVVRALLAAAREAASIELALRALEIYRGAGFPPHTNVYNQVLSAHILQAKKEVHAGGGQALDATLRYYDSVASEEADWYLVNRQALLQLCVRSGRLDAATVLVEEMLANNESINRRILRDMLVAEHREGTIDDETLRRWE